MKTKILSIDEAVHTGWDKMKKNFWYFVLLFLIIWAVDLIFSFLQTKTESSAVVYTILIILNICLSILFGLAIIKISIKVVDGEKVDLSDLYIHYKYTWKFFIASLLKALVVLVGLVFLIVPGIYLSLRFRFVEYLILDKDMGIIESFKESARISSGVKWSIMGLEFVSFIISLLGLLALVVGLFAAAPTAIIARAYMYRTLEKETAKA